MGPAYLRFKALGINVDEGLRSIVEISHPDNSYMGGCQKYGPFSDPHYNTAPNI